MDSIRERGKFLGCLVFPGSFNEGLSFSDGKV